MLTSTIDRFGLAFQYQITKDIKKNGQNMHLSVYVSVRHYQAQYYAKCCACRQTGTHAHTLGHACTHTRGPLYLILSMAQLC